MGDCLFCSIADGGIKSDIIYEDELCVAFNDIDPQAPVHFCVIPREHIAGAGDITRGNSAVVAHIFEVIASLSEKLSLDGGYRVVTNVGEDGGQSIKHLHFHVLAGRKLAWPPG